MKGCILPFNVKILHFSKGCWWKGQRNQTQITCNIDHINFSPSQTSSSYNCHWQHKNLIGITIFLCIGVSTLSLTRRNIVLEQSKPNSKILHLWPVDVRNIAHYWLIRIPSNLAHEIWAEHKCKGFDRVLLHSNTTMWYRYILLLFAQ